MTDQLTSITDLPSIKKGYAKFLAKFGKTPPERVVCQLRDGNVLLHGSIPGTQVTLSIPDTSSGPSVGFALALEHFKTLLGCKAEILDLTVGDSFVEAKSGRSTLRLAKDSDGKVQDPAACETELSPELVDFLGYVLPIFKKTSSSLARNELMLECATEQYGGFAATAFVGSKIHVVETASTDGLDPYTESEQSSLSLVLAADLLEGMSGADGAPRLVVDGNSVIMDDGQLSVTTQLREHSLGVGYQQVSSKVRETDDSAVSFKFKPEKLADILSDVPLTGKGEYEFVMRLEQDSLQVRYVGPGARFSSSVKVARVGDASLEEGKEFSLEIKELIPVLQVFADAGNVALATVLNSRVLFSIKSELGYRHYVAMSRVS